VPFDTIVIHNDEVMPKTKLCINSVLSQ